MKIPLCEPDLGPREANYVRMAIDSGWVGGRGTFIDGFEEKFARFVGVDYAITCSSGTAALQLALMACGINPQTNVYTAQNTFIASKNMARLLTPRVSEFASDNTWNMPIKATSKLAPGVILGVHLYGNPLNLHHWDRKRHMLIEDCAQALGSRYYGKRLGSFGKASIFSFHSAKMLTTGEGGMVCTDDANVAKAVCALKNHCMERPYVHTGLGFNFRMTNIQAAMGLGQLERIDELMGRKREITRFYDSHLDKCFVRQKPTGGSDVVKWLNAYSHPRAAEIARKLADRGIETRPGFIGDDIIGLPSSTKLTDSELSYICEAANAAAT